MNYVAKAYTKCNVDAEILLNSLYWFEYQKQQMAYAISALIVKKCMIISLQ